MTGSFQSKYRMSRSAFDLLVVVLEPYMDHDTTNSNVLEPITKLTIVALGVRYMTGEQARSLSDIFRLRQCFCLRG